MCETEKKKVVEPKKMTELEKEVWERLQRHAVTETFRELLLDALKPVIEAIEAEQRTLDTFIT